MLDGKKTYIAAITIERANQEVGINTVNPTTTLDVNGELTINDPPSIGSTGDNLCGDASGDTIISQNSGDTADCIVSSERFKKNIEDLTGALDRILQYRPVSFEYIATNKPSKGFLAEEIMLIRPESVFYEADNVTPRSIHEYDILTDAVGAIQELKAENDELKRRISALESK